MRTAFNSFIARSWDAAAVAVVSLNAARMPMNGAGSNGAAESAGVATMGPDVAAASTKNWVSRDQGSLTRYGRAAGRTIVSQHCAALAAKYAACYTSPQQQQRQVFVNDANSAFKYPSNGLGLNGLKCPACGKVLHGIRPRGDVFFFQVPDHKYELLGPDIPEIQGYFYK